MPNNVMIASLRVNQYLTAAVMQSKLLHEAQWEQDWASHAVPTHYQSTHRS